MALTKIDNTMLSDLLLNDIDPSVGRSRRVVNVTTAADMPLGTVVFRTATSKSAVDQAAPYAPVTDAEADLVAGNELAVVFGDKLGCKAVVEADESGTTQAVAFVGFGAVLKDQLPLSVNGIERDSAAHKALKALLEAQGVVLAKTLGAE